MGMIVSTQFVDGATLTADDLNGAFKEVTDVVNGGIDDANVKAGSLPPRVLTSPNALFSIAVPCSIYFDALGGIGGTYSQSEMSASRIGLNKSICGSDVDIPVPVPLTCTVVSVSTSCHHLVGTDAKATLLLDGSEVSATETAFADGSTVTTTGLSVALTSSSVLKVRAHAPDGVGGGLVAPVVHLLCSAQHSLAV